MPARREGNRRKVLIRRIRAVEWQIIAIGDKVIKVY